jgi:outer membrane protein insertion porin family
VNYSVLDRGYLPTSGYSTSLDYEYLGGPLGSEVDLSKAVWSGTVYLPAYETDAGLKHVLTLQGAFGWQEEHSNMDSVPIFERFFAGGVSGYFPCKGFRWRGIGPRDKDVPIGGKAALALSAEYSIPLVSDYQRELDTEVSRVKGVFYVDAANVAEDIHDGDLTGRIRSAYGVGLKIHLPVLGGFPIALYYGIPWKKFPGDERRSFNINMSTVF